MAFATGHKQPAGFVAGQLKDGASVGKISVASFGGQAQDFDIFVRYYKNKLVALVGRSKPDGTVLAPPLVVQRQYVLNLVDLALPNDIPFIKSFAALVADEAGLNSVGLAPQQNVPTNATSELIPFAMNADGKVEAFTSAADTVKAQQAVVTKQNEVLTKLADSVTTGGNTSGGTGGTSSATSGGGMLSKMTNTTKIIIGVVVVAVIGGIVYMVMKPKKGGRK